MRLPALLGRLLPDLGAISLAERLRASAGAALGLLVTGLVSRAALGSAEGLPLLTAPMGASAVLLFAVPSSPLAQPWSILGGNVVAALIGVTAARFIPDPITAAAVGGAFAIAAMMVLRCLHPPSGAVALTAVLGGPAIKAAGYTFALWPVGLNSVLLLAVALAFNNLTGRRYPHLPPRQTTASALQGATEAVLRRHDELIDIGRSDLVSLLDEVETDLARGHAGGLSRCADLMRQERDALPTTATLEAALDRLIQTGRSVLPVVDATGCCAGVVTQADLLGHLRPTRTGRRVARLFQRSIRFDLAPASLGAVTRPQLVQARPGLRLDRLVDIMLRTGVDYVPVTDDDGKLVGGLMQADLLSWLLAETRKDAPAHPSSVIQRL